MAGRLGKREEDGKTDTELTALAGNTYLQNFPATAWFGRCIFLSWYCDVGSCDFCFRSTTKHKIRHAKTAKRDTESIVADAIIGKNLGWRLEFLTGGYRIFPFEEIAETARLVSAIYGEKIWVNLGALNEEQLIALKPYVAGVCASIETVNPELHNRICPDKPIQPYSEMLILAGKLGFKKSATIVIGLGETESDFALLADFIRTHELDRITLYALKPVKGTHYTASPEPSYYAWWIAKTRATFPKLEIMAGLTPKKAEEYVKLILVSGANAITKFPAVKKFGSEQAKEVERQVKLAGREFMGSLTEMPDVDWEAEVEKLPADDKLRKRAIAKIKRELEGMGRY
jgi:biotin synthase-like enzyme